MVPLVLLLSCTGDPPEIRQVFWQLNAEHDSQTGNREETLSVFINVADADGVDDVDLLYILQDDNELLWELQPDGWQRLENGDEMWIGSNNLRMEASTPFPRDLYRVIVIDKSGERSRDEFYINSSRIDLPKVNFPKGQINDGTISLTGGFSEYTLWFYDGEENIVKIFSTNETSLPLLSALDSREVQIASHFYIFTSKGSTGYSLIYGPVYIDR